MQSEKLIQSLIEQTRQIINQAEALRNHDLKILTWKETAESWSMLECLEHLNLYGDFYLPEMEKKIKESNTTPDVNFKSGILGNYFAKSMLPKEKLNKMKTFKDKNPLHAKLDQTVIDRFMGHQMKLLDLLQAASNKSLNRIRIATSITSLLKLKLGDCFQFYINHMIRHMHQIERVKQAMKAN